jgi:hypothetical protein
MGVERQVSREWPTHRAFLRRHQCCVAGCLGLPIVVAHVRSAANSGIGLKPSDASAIPLCVTHHTQQHSIGQTAFERLYKIDLTELAEKFAGVSPDRKMKEALKVVVAGGKHNDRA